MLVVAVTTTASAHAETKLSRIFRYEMIGSQVAYLEKTTGPALSVLQLGDFENREYRVESCKVEAYVNHGVAMGYSLELGPKCNVDLGDIVSRSNVSTKGLTLAKFHADTTGDVHARSNCISMCGNAADPSIDFVWSGPHAARNIMVVFSITLSTRSSLDAKDRLLRILRAKENEEYIVDTKFSCDRKYDRAALDIFSNIAINKITVGFDPNEAFYNNNCK